MNKCYFVYFNILFFILNVSSSLASENRYDTYELDFSSEEREFLVKTNSKFSFYFKDEAWIYIKNPKNNSFIRLLRESYHNGATFTFQTSKKIGNIVLTFSYQNVKDSREFTKNVILKISQRKVVNKLSEKELSEDKKVGLKNINDDLNFKEIARRALNLSYINDYEGAIKLLNGYNFNESEYTLLKADLYYKNGDYLNSYENYLSIRDRHFDKIFLNLIHLGIKLNRVENVIRDTRFLIENNIDFSENVYLDILEFLLLNCKYDFFLNFSSLYFPKYANSRFLDRYNYLLGRLYETQGKYRDFLKSLDYYKKVIDEYPFSDYYEISKLRYLFLKRFF
ncbi:hypothetical protein F0310_00210 [Borrelia sp. A-FGy1]|uniref:tetratricopeptide repeat protein n=1 Tax=Borrelia sp. A-FGy1 TaxID=2608247 RepID=UPI0015F4537A|nr:hypothetical protein [Borrelia sp. A-FGy1]QMU98862.1 hypothetical protein F0310_00210 [Borrelia sp. A-FGy1]